jgi:glycosyltransferase involved in cell wall biosynthesis
MTIALLLPAAPDLAPFARRMGEALQTLRDDVQMIAMPSATALPDDGPRVAAAEVLPLCADVAPLTVLLHDIIDDIGPLASARRIIVPSEFIRSRLIRDHGIDAEGITVIAPGTEALPRSTGSGSATCHILAIGPLIARMGYPELIEALARLPDLDWSLCIAADDLEAPLEPASADAVRASIATHNLQERVRLVAAPDWQQDLFASTCDYEAYGEMIAEALRRGLPVAVTNVGAVPTLVGPEAGVVCAPGEIDQMSKALRRLIFDTNLRNAMAEIAWQSGQALPTWQDQAKQLLELIA